MHPHSFLASRFSGGSTALVSGEYGVAKLFLGLLTRSDVCAGLHESFTTLSVCACVCVRCVSLVPRPFWLMRDTMPLTNKSEHIDTFVGPLEPSLLRLCLQMLSVLGQLLSPSTLSVHDLMLLVDEFSSFRSFMRVLMIVCMSPAIFTCPPSVSIFLPPLIEEAHWFSQALPRPILWSCRLCLVQL